MEISIIIPVYNSSKFLDKCIQSLINQDFEKNYEIILINDGSIDKSESIILSYILKYKNKIKYKAIENRGCSYARNLGVDISSGKYILFVDSDDYVKPNFCREMYNKISENNFDLVSSGIYLIDSKYNIIENKKEKTGLSIIEYLENDDMSGYVVNKIFKRDIIIKNKIKFLENVHMFEDKAFTTEYLLCSKEISFLEKSFYYYLMNESSVMNSLSIKKIDEAIKSVEKIRTILYSSQISKEKITRLFNKIYKNRVLDFIIVCSEKSILNKQEVDGKLFKKYFSNYKIKYIKLLFILKIVKYFPKDYLFIKNRIKKIKYLIRKEKY